MLFYLYIFMSLPHCIGCLVFMSLPLVSSLAGITAQSEKFPVRFIVDLLNKQQRIVLTGECVKLW